MRQPQSLDALLEHLIGGLGVGQKLAECRAQLAWDEVNYLLSENRDTTSIMRRGNDDFESLDEDDQSIFFYRTLSRVNFYYSAMRLAGDGFIGEEYANSVAATIPLLLGEDGGIAVWQQVGPNFPASFQGHVNSLLESGIATSAQ